MLQARKSDYLPCPRPDEVHVWTVFLPKMGPELARLQNLLSAEEQSKATGFLREEDYKRYVVAHGILRELLGRYLSVIPQKIEFVANAFGKPALSLGNGFQPLFFNLAHSGDIVLFGVTHGRNVGVDVEMIREDLNFMELAEGQFSPMEFTALQATPEPRRAAAFFRCWTRKEAYLKARGEGLGFPLKQFSVAFGENEIPAVLWVSDDDKASKRWSVFDVLPSPSHAAAVVVEGRGLHLVSQSWHSGV